MKQNYDVEENRISKLPYGRKAITENNLTQIIKRIRKHEVTKLLSIQGMFVIVA